MSLHKSILAWSLAPAVLIATLSGCARVERSYEAALVLTDLTAGRTPSRLKTVTPTPERTEIGYRVAERDYRADLYRPGETPLAALVLVHGLVEQGKNDPRLQDFAMTLARARFTVLVPDIESFRTLDLDSGDARDVADAVTFLTRQTPLAPGGRAGISAFSYGVGPAILAALEPDIRQQVDFVLAIGGYYDLVEAIGYITTGYYRVAGERRYREPNPLGKWLMLTIHLDRIEDAADREVLAQVAERKLKDPKAGVADLTPRLGPEGQAVYAFVTNRDPDRVAELIARLPPEVVAEIRALNLANKDLRRLRARLLLVHGLDDEVIPYSHSVALAAALPPTQARLFLVGGLFHVDVDPGVGDAWRLWRAAAALLALRDE